MYNRWRNPSIARVYTTKPNAKSLRIPITIHVGEKTVIINALIDSGAEGIFINSSLIKNHQLPTQKYKKPILARNVDGTLNKEAQITEYVLARTQMAAETKEYKIAATNLGEEDAILGIPWLKTANPIINWNKGTITINSLHTSKTDTLNIPEYCLPWKHIFEKEAAE